MSSAKWRPFCLGLNVLTRDCVYTKRLILVARESAIIRDMTNEDISHRLNDFPGIYTAVFEAEEKASVIINY